MRMTSAKLHRARVEKNDEFYTRMIDIQEECDNYLDHFKGKVIYCNCDTEQSNFVKYFRYLKNRGMIKDIIHTGGLGGLDFRSRQSVELLEQADIVISNPPFSLFRQYITQIFDYNKDFLILGPMSAFSYKEVFEHIKNNKMWNGTRALGGALSMMFDVPNQKDLIESGKSHVFNNGVAQAQISATWFTNLKHNKQKPLVFTKTYAGNESDYPKYDNYDAINIDRKTRIPSDYYGVMGLPITFLDRYNPEQFVILGLDKDLTTDGKGCRIQGKSLYTRVFVKRKSANSSANDNDPLTEKAA